MYEFFNRYETLTSDLKSVEKIISGISADIGNPALAKVIQEAVKGKGKMLRAAFVILSARSGTFNSERVYALAAAIELFHLATLIHDDIVDEAEERRGVPALHVSQGAGKAVLAGDYLLVRAMQLVSFYRRNDNVSALTGALGRLCESVIDEESGGVPSMRRYLRKTAGKTAVLFMLSCYAGAEEGGLNDLQCAVFRRIGYNFGMSFQIIDDVLDFDGRRDKLGKPVGRDLQAGIITLPVIMAMAENQDQFSSLVQQAAKIPEAVDRLLNKVVSGSYCKKAMQVARQYTHRAVSEIGKLPDTREKEVLLLVVEQLLERNY